MISETPDGDERVRRLIRRAVRQVYVSDFVSNLSYEVAEKIVETGECSESDQEIVMSANEMFQSAKSGAIEN